MKVLFCTDGSDASYNAIERAIPFLKSDIELDVINVVDEGFFPTYVSFQYETEEGMPEFKGVAEEILDRTKTFIETRGLKINQTIYSSGHPDKVILETIKDGFYDLAILGSHSKKGLVKWLGSVSRKVITKSPITSFVAKAIQPAFSNSHEKILFALDGSAYSKNALSVALDLLNFSSHPLIELMAVYPGADSFPIEITMDTKWLDECITKQKELADSALEEGENIVQAKGLSVNKKIALEGEPASKILSYTEANAHDLIVMGSHGRGAMPDMLLGSVSKRILDNAFSSVMIVPMNNE